MTNAIRRTKKQCLEEKRTTLWLQANKLAEMPQDFPPGRTHQLMRTMEVLMQTLSERQSNLLQHMGAQYGSDIRQTAARMLSEFTTAITDLPNISARMKKYQTIFETSGLGAELEMQDRWALEAFAATLASGGAVIFTVRKGHKGVQITGSRKGEQILP